MLRYLFTTLPSNDLGLLTRSLPIARELRGRGHAVAFCSPARAPRRLIADAGFPNLLPVDPAYYIISSEISVESARRLLASRHRRRHMRITLDFVRRHFRTSTDEIWDIGHFMYLFGMWDADFVKANVDTVIELMDTYRPDVVVDFWNPFAVMAARVTGKPLVTVIQADMHPQSRGFMWWVEAPPAHPDPTAATNVVRAAYGLPPIDSIGELLIGDLTLVVGMPETDPLPESADVHYIGPVLWQRDEEEDLPAWVEGFAGGMPLVWVYPGNLRYMRGGRTCFDSAVVLEACRDALRDEPVRVAVSTGHHALPRAFEPLPANFHHASYLPGLAMAARSDLLVHHGGYGSCQTGLYTGTPALVVPTYSERESNARRIAAQGAGDYVLPSSDASGRRKRVSAGELRHKARAILADPAYAENARRLGDKMKTYGGPARAADLIEERV
jgi:UDP:flavonoid glycosyltransferase YjiC (YdhE family)